RSCIRYHAAHVELTGSPGIRFRWERVGHRGDGVVRIDGARDAAGEAKVATGDPTPVKRHDRGVVHRSTGDVASDRAAVRDVRVGVGVVDGHPVTPVAPRRPRVEMDRRLGAKLRNAGYA